MTVAVKLENVSRHFGAVRAVEDVNLTIEEGEFFALLGPSGSGKTTTLRLIAGFERADKGGISIFDSLVNDVPPYRRPVNTVFQDYALFPHLSVLENVAYSLKVKGVNRDTRHREATAALQLVHLPDHARRKPSELSGGQRQRVALARAIVGKPRVLLLDEPLGALDLKLRESMQIELKALQQQLGITFVFVTHDQNEALSLADRIAVFNEGRVVQVASPQTIYRKPATRFVADFVGSSNVLEPDLVHSLTGQRRWGSLRPEDIRIRMPEQTTSGSAGTEITEGATDLLRADVVDRSYLGGQTRLTLRLQDRSLFCLIPSRDAQPVPGDKVILSWDQADMHMMEP